MPVKFLLKVLATVIFILQKNTAFPVTGTVITKLSESFIMIEVY